MKNGLEVTKVSNEIVVCPECLEQFKKWLYLQAHRDSSTKLRQTKAYALYERLERGKDIKVK